MPDKSPIDEIQARIKRMPEKLQIDDVELEDIIADLERKARRKARRKPLGPEMELARKRNLDNLYKMVRRMDICLRHGTASLYEQCCINQKRVQLEEDRRYIQKLIGRFQRKEWYYLPAHRKTQLNKMWKECE